MPVSPLGFCPFLEAAATLQGDAHDVRQGLLRADVVVAGEQIAGVVLRLDRRESLIGPRWIDRGDILFGGSSEEVCVGAADMRCESPPDRFQAGRAASTGFR